MVTGLWLHEIIVFDTKWARKQTRSFWINKPLLVLSEHEVLFILRQFVILGQIWILTDHWQEHRSQYHLQQERFALSEFVKLADGCNSLKMSAYLNRLRKEHRREESNDEWSNPFFTFEVTKLDSIESDEHHADNSHNPKQGPSHIQTPPWKCEFLWKKYISRSEESLWWLANLTSCRKLFSVQCYLVWIVVI